MEETLHFTLDKNAGKFIVDVAREIAYQTKTYNDAIVFLFASGITDYELCRELLNGQKTLNINKDKEGHQVFIPIIDTWQPPEKNEEKMKKETIHYCKFVISNEPYSGKYAYKVMRNEQEIATLIVRAMQILEIVEIVPRLAYKHMLQLKEEINNETQRRVTSQSKSADQFTVNERTQEIINSGIPILRRSKKYFEKCDDTICKYNKVGKCSFMLRERCGCIMDVPLSQKYADEITNLDVITTQEHNNKHHLHKANKQFNFVFKGHEYTYNDSARNQGRCPHCDQPTMNFMIDPIKDIDKFECIGFKQLSDTECVVCFECLKCHNKLFYHQDLTFIKQQLDISYPELKDKFYGM